MLPGVSKTAILTLRARVDEHHRPDRVLVDPLAAQWWTRVEWPPELDSWYSASTGLAFRADDIDHVLARLCSAFPIDAVTELGCGLSTRNSRAQLGVPWVDVDLPPVSALRVSWGAGGEQIGCSVLDDAWMASVPGERPVFIIEGLLYYLPRAAVDGLFAELSRRFPGAFVIMDVLGRADFAKLHEMTQAIGSPIAWGYEGEYDAVLPAFGLTQVPDFSPARLTEESIARYWHRLDHRTRGGIYFARHSPDIWAMRSGVVVGAL